MLNEVILVSKLSSDQTFMENPKNLIIVIFGASGDLTSRKLMPAIFSLKNQNLLPERLPLLVLAGQSILTEDFRKKMKEAIILIF